MSQKTTSLPANSYPEDADLVRFVKWRNSIATFWRRVFLASLVVSLLALLALLYTIINNAFGLVAIENQVDPAALVLALHPGVVRTSMGGPSAPLDIETSVTGVADVIAARWGNGGHVFVDYRNQIIPW